MDANKCDLRLNIIVAIMKRGSGNKISEALASIGMRHNLVLLGMGTVSSEVLNYMGLGELEKDVIISTAPTQMCADALKLLDEKFELSKPNTGIAFSVPISGLGGIKTFSFLSHFDTVMSEKEFKKKKEVSKVEKPASEGKFDLVMTIVNRGFSDDVIDAARENGAEGGTILHARGTGIHETAKFFGVAIQPDKELVLTLVPRNIRAAVINGICEKAGLSKAGKGISFSLPVGDVKGIAHLENMRKNL